MTDAAQTDPATPPEPEARYSAFISYASPDLEQAEAICASLESRGFTCWIAPRNVRSGREYGQEIIRGIESARCLILVLSAAANESTYVRREVERAVSKRKPVFPVRIEEVMPSPALELFVSTTHWIDAWSGPLGEHVERLATDLGDDDALAAAVAPVSMPRRRRQSVTPWLWVAGAVAALLMISGVVATVNRLTGGGGHAPDPDHGWTWSAEDSQKMYRQVIDELGVDPASITAADIRVVPETNSSSPGVGIRIEHSMPMVTLASQADLYFAIGDDPLRREGTGSKDRLYRTSLDQQKLARDKSVTLRYDLKDGRTIGPFTYPLDPAAAHANANVQAAARLDAWAEPYGTDVPMLNFRRLYRERQNIAAIRLGASPAALDRTITVFARSGDTKRIDPHFVSDIHGNSVPVPPELRAIYVQLVFTDGQTSDVRRVDLPEWETPIVRLRPLDKATAKDGPAVYALYNGRLAFMPMSPPGTTRIVYAIDAGRFEHFDLRDHMDPGGQHAGGVTDAGRNDLPTAGPLADATSFDLLFQFENGAEAGPFRYRVEPVFDLPIAYFKPLMTTKRRELVGATRLADADQLTRAVRQQGNQQPPLRHVGEQALADSLPAVVLHASAEHHRDNGWVSVAAVAYGTAEDRLDQRVELAYTPRQLMTGQPPLDPDVRRWYALLPGDTQALFCQLVFRDGEKTEPFRVPIDQP